MNNVLPLHTLHKKATEQAARLRRLPKTVLQQLGLDGALDAANVFGIVAMIFDDGADIFWLPLGDFVDLNPSTLRSGEYRLRIYTKGVPACATLADTDCDEWVGKQIAISDDEEAGGKLTGSPAEAAKMAQYANHILQCTLASTSRMNIEYETRVERLTARNIELSEENGALKGELRAIRLELERLKEDHDLDPRLIAMLEKILKRWGLLEDDESQSQPAPKVRVTQQPQRPPEPPKALE